MERSFGLVNALLLIIITGRFTLEYAGFQGLMLASAAIYVILLGGGLGLLVFPHAFMRRAAAEKSR